ncbi:tyrosine-type recombinase/integrase [Sabulicella glaciei]|uniref:Site-specific integrase n=1 Tax=Sabulicella glaciei TaxID=2984948 RepID=A0ABT3NZW7_9PROT|nr:site-specific integrase [Roseococcus sp. MDT2-1-1]MCW8087676.1 site-specific integrase [Roseococcus sp. MDT2-1-1]
MGARPSGHAALPFASWPEADRATYLAACTPGSPFDDPGAAASWRPATHRSLCAAYSRWLGFLQSEGVVLAEEGPAERVTPERLRHYERMLRGRCASVTVATYLGQLLMFLTDLWPERNWRWLREIQARHQRLAQPSRVKAARMVDQMELVELGFSLMEQAVARPLPPDLTAGPSHPALLYRDGLMIALLALRPLRQGNFLNLILGRHLQRTPEGWRIAIPASECKTGLALHMVVPAQLLSALETYLTVYRPVLLDMRGPADRQHRLHPAGHALWVTRCGTAMTPGAQQKQLRRHCRARFGHDINPHLFRDCAATTLADEHPEGISLAADLLGHRSTTTTQAHYIAANQRKALQQCQALILAQRRPSSRKGRTP